MGMKPLALAIGFAVCGLVAVGSGQSSTLSEADQLRFRLHRTKIELEQALSNAASCRAQLRSVQLTEEQARMKADIEKRYPGFTFDVQAGQLVEAK